MIKQIVASVLAIASTAGIAATHGKKAADTTATTTPTAIRDWSKVDTNRDNLVSAEEMEKFLSSAWVPCKTAHKTADKWPDCFPVSSMAGSVMIARRLLPT